MKTRVLTLTLALVVCGGLVALAATKAPAPSAPAHRSSDDFMARMTKDLGLSKKQADTISSILTKSREEMRKVWESKISDESKRTKAQAISADTQKKVLAVLTPEQKKKAQNMHFGAPSGGRGGFGGTRFADTQRAILKDLKLSKTQQPKVDAILKDFDKKSAALLADTKLSPDQRRTKMEAVRKEAETKIAAVLTADQKKKYQAAMAQHNRGAGRRPGAAPAGARPGTRR